MTLFQSVGSNYRARDVWRHTLAVGGPRQRQRLAAQLTERFNGEATMIFQTGRAALSEAVRVLTAGKGAVVVNAFTCSVVVDAVRAAGCEVVYLDITPDRLHFDAATLKDLLNNRPDIKAVIIQNSLGIPVDIVALEKISRDHRVALIEDIAHAVGGYYQDGRAIGTVGAASVLSFGRDKMLDTVNGGALVWRAADLPLSPRPATRQPRLIDRLRDRLYPLIALTVRALFRIGLGGVVLRAAYGLKLAVRSADAPVRRDLTMPGWQARLALRQVERLDELTSQRQQVARRYQALSDLMPQQASSSAVRIPLLVANRPAVLKALKRERFYLEDIWYDVPVAPARLYDTQNFPETENPVTTKLTKQIINLPTHQLVSERQAEMMVKVIQEVALPWK